MVNKFSILIISYNRPDDLLELLRDVDQLADKATLLEEVVIINNRSTSDYSKVEAFITQNQSISFNYHVAEENGGVSKGRNLAMARAKGDLWLFLDDDILLPDKEMLRKLHAFFTSEFAMTNNVGIVTPSIHYYDTKEVQVNAFPHKQFQKYASQSTFLTYYYSGAAHIIRKEVIAAAGTLPENFFYGMEEYDLSYRAIGAGFTLAYDRSVLIWHKESPLGRTTPREKLRMMWVNKSIVAWKYLPLRYAFSTAICWSLLYASKFFIKGYFKGWNRIFHQWRSTKHTPLPATALRYLEKTNARLWY